MIRFQGIVIDRQKRIVANHGTVIQFRRLRFHFVCALILAGPMTKTALFDLLYDGREDGGPITGVKIIDIFLCQTRPQLAALGWEICTDRPYGDFRRYWAAPFSSSLKALEAAE